MIEGTPRKELDQALGDRVQFDVPLSRHTSLRVGGPAAAIAAPANRDELARLLAICSRHGIPHSVLGSGFNAIAPDSGYAGVVIRMNSWRRLEAEAAGRLRAESGVSHSQITNFCVEHGYSGLEFACGIPGSVGGWIAMNAGIPEREIKDAVLEVEVMDPNGASPQRLQRDELDFGYRALRGLADGTLILSALFEVREESQAHVKAEVERLLAKRSDAQPLNRPSCGSVFKNPPGDFAGRLIESVGLKGRRIGGAEISQLHANFITNLGGATAGDIQALIEEVQKQVYDATGIRLVPEVRILGRTT